MHLTLSAPARKALSAANTHASRAGASDIQPHHILLGLLDDASCTAARLLATRGLDPADLSRQLHRRLPATTKPRLALGMLPHAPATAHLVDRAAQHASTLNHPHVDTGHLLLAVLHDPSTPEGQVLTVSGLTADMVLEQVQPSPFPPEAR